MNSAPMIMLRLSPVLAVLLLAGTGAVAQMSLTPPGGNGTTKRIGRDG